MTHKVSLLCWLSAGLYDVFTLVTTGSTITTLALLVDISTVLFSRPISWLSSGLALSLAHHGWWVAEWTLSTHTVSRAWLCRSTNSSRVCWAVAPVTQQVLLSLTPFPWARTPSTNSARVCWAAAPGLLPPTQQGCVEPQHYCIVPKL